MWSWVKESFPKPSCDLDTSKWQYSITLCLLEFHTVLESLDVMVDLFRLVLPFIYCKFHLRKPCIFVYHDIYWHFPFFLDGFVSLATWIVLQCDLDIFTSRVLLRVQWSRSFDRSCHGLGPSPMNCVVLECHCLQPSQFSLRMLGTIPAQASKESK